MSDLMFYGVLRMPYEMAMADELSRLQFYSRAKEAADRIEAADKRIAELEAENAAHFTRCDEMRDALCECRTKLQAELEARTPAAAALPELDALRELAAKHGKALLPRHLTREMMHVMDAEGWQWEDLLATAEAITEEQYNEISASPVPASEVVGWAYWMAGHPHDLKHIQLSATKLRGYPGTRPLVFGDAVLVAPVPASEASSEAGPAPGVPPCTGYAYSLTDLQTAAREQYGMTPYQTLAAAQGLYERNLISCPKTEERRLAEYMFEESANIIHSYNQVSGRREHDPEYQAPCWARDVDARMGILVRAVPAAALFDVSMSEAETRIYRLVHARFLSLFIRPGA